MASHIICFINRLLVRPGLNLGIEGAVDAEQPDADNRQQSPDYRPVEIFDQAPVHHSENRPSKILQNNPGFQSRGQAAVHLSTASDRFLRVFQISQNDLLDQRGRNRSPVAAMFDYCRDAYPGVRSRRIANEPCVVLVFGLGQLFEQFPVRPLGHVHDLGACRSCRQSGQRDPVSMPRSPRVFHNTQQGLSSQDRTSAGRLGSCASAWV